MATQESPLPARIPARTWLFAAVVGAGAFMAMLDSTVANLAVDTIRTDFDSTLPTIQWIITAYLVALAISLPATAWLGNRFGYGRTWAVSMAVFIIGSALCGLATGPVLLIGARLIQGMAAGIMVPAGQALIATYVGRDQLGRIFGTLGFVIALGPAIGPAVGGFLVEFTSWRWLFWINLPIGIAALFIAHQIVPAGEYDTGAALDTRGFVLLGTGLPLFLFGGFDIGTTGITVPALAILTSGTVLIVAFIFHALAAHKPLLQLHLLRHRRFAVSVATTGLTGANLFGGLLLFPLYLQLVAHQDIAQTGIMLLIMGFGSAVALPVAGMLIDRIGETRVIMCGAILLIITTLPFLVIEPSRSWLALLLFVRGIALALAQMPAMTAAYKSVNNTEMGDAAALVNIVQRLGGALGAIALVLALEHAADGMGFQSAFVVLAGISLATFILPVMGSIDAQRFRSMA